MASLGLLNYYCEVWGLIKAAALRNSLLKTQDALQCILNTQNYCEARAVCHEGKKGPPSPHQTALGEAAAGVQDTELTGRYKETDYLLEVLVLSSLTQSCRIVLTLPAAPHPPPPSPFLAVLGLNTGRVSHTRQAPHFATAFHPSTANLVFMFLSPQQYRKEDLVLEITAQESELSTLYQG